MLEAKKSGKETKKNGEPFFTSLFIDAQPALFTHVSILLGGDTETAKDVLQDTNALLWERREQFDPSRASFLTWAKACASTVVLTARKKALRESKKVVYTEDVYDEVASKLAEQPEEPSDLILALRRCMKRLHGKDRLLLKRRYEDRLGLSDLVEEWHLSVSALAMKFMRLRKGLEACIRRQICQLDNEESENGEEPFSDALEDALLDGPSGKDRLNAVLSARPEFIDSCIGQLFIHSLLSLDSDLRQKERKVFFAKVHACLRVGAAAALVALAAGGLFAGRTRQKPAATVKDLSASLPPVQISAPRTEMEPPPEKEQANLAVPFGPTAAAQPPQKPTALEPIASTTVQKKDTEMNTNSIIRTLTTAAVSTAIPLGVAAAAPSTPTMTFQGYINGNVDLAFTDLSSTIEVQMKTTSEDAFTDVAGTIATFKPDWNRDSQREWTLATNLVETMQIRVRASNTDGTSNWTTPYTFTPNLRAAGTMICSKDNNGKAIGTNGFDGKISTFIDTPHPAWAGIDLGKPKRVSAMRVAPRLFQGQRMANCKFQCASMPDFSDAATLYTFPNLTVSDKEVVTCTLDTAANARYFRLYGQKTGISDYYSVGEIEFSLAKIDAPVLSVSSPDMTNQWPELSWTYPGTVYCASSIVQRATSKGGPYTNLASMAVNVTAYEDTTALIGVPYYYRIQSVALPCFADADNFSDPISYTRCRRLERSWDNLAQLAASVSTLPSGSTLFYGGHETAVFDGNIATFGDMGNDNNPYIGLDLGQAYHITKVLAYPRSTGADGYRLNGITLWGSNDSTLAPATGLYTFANVALSHWIYSPVTDTGTAYRYVFLHSDTGKEWFANIAELGLFGYSDDDTRTNLGSVVTAPESLTLAREAGKVSVSWTAGRNATSYSLQRRVKGTETWADLVTGLSAATLSYDDTGVTTNTIYEYRLVVVNETQTAYSGIGTAFYFSSGNGTGLLGTYLYPFLLSTYTNTESVVRTKVDATIHFNWALNDSLIDTTNAPDNVRITWTGKLIVPVSGAYLFSVEADDGAALRIDDTFLLNRWYPGSFTAVATNYLTAGEHDLRLDYVQVTSAKKCILKWGGTQWPLEIIPATQLIPAASFTDEIDGWKCRTFFEDQVGIHRKNADGSYSISGHGNDIGGTQQAYTYMWQEFTGPFDLQAKLTISSRLGSGGGKGLLMVRNRLDNDNSGQIFAPFTFLSNWGVKIRTNETASIDDHVNWKDFPGKSVPTWLRLCRAGKTIYAMGRNSEKESWLTYDTYEDVNDTFGRKVYIGMAVCNPDYYGNNPSAISLCTFSNVVLQRYSQGTVIMLR